MPQDDVVMRATIVHAAQSVEAWIAACLQDVAEITHRNQDVVSSATSTRIKQRPSFFTSQVARGNLSCSSRGLLASARIPREVTATFA
jgi:hypothetical protein